MGPLVSEAILQVLFQGLVTQIRGPEPYALGCREAGLGVFPHSGEEHLRSAQLGQHSAEDAYGSGSRHYNLLTGLYVRSNVHGVHGHS